MRRLAVLAAALAVACGSTASAGPSATGATQPAASSSAAPSATAMTSSRGFITVRQPLPRARVTSPFVITGDANVFEAALQWRVVDGTGRVMAEGMTTASAGAPAGGTFSIDVAFTASPADANGAIEVFTRSPKDGQIDDIVRVPVVIAR